MDSSPASATEDPSTSSVRAVAWAWDAILRHGQPDTGHHVRIPLTQTELARIDGCSAGTIAWYLRCLGPAVRRRRGGIVLDRRALSGLEHSHAARPPSPRSAAVHEALLEAFGRPSAGGVEVELVIDGRPASLARLGEQLGINRSSAHRHVVALERDGHLQRRGRRLYAVASDPGGGHPPGTRPRTGDSVNSSPSEDPGHCRERALALLERITELLGAVAELTRDLLGAVPATADPRTVGAQDPRTVGAQTPLRAAPVAVRPHGSSSGDDLIDRSDEITSNQSEGLRANGSRNSGPLRASSSRTDAGSDWTPEELPTLLAPLLEQCCRLDLPGVTDPGRVAASLEPYSAEQVTAAARQMAADLRGGAPMRSPVAILIRKARDRDPYYFRRAPEPPRATVPRPPLLTDAEEPGPDPEAVAAVAQLGGGALERLDDDVAAHLRGLLGPGRAETVLTSPQTLAYWRPRLWRREHPTPTQNGEPT